MKARNDENLEGIQGLARGLGRLLPGGGTRGEAIAELQARAEEVEREGFARYAEAKQEADLLRVKLEAAERNASKLDNDLEAADAALDDERREVARLRGDLEQIRDQNPVENALDPQWAARIARHALAILGEGQVSSGRVCRACGKDAWDCDCAILDGEGEK